MAGHRLGIEAMPPRWRLYWGFCAALGLLLAAAIHFYRPGPRQATADPVVHSASIAELLAGNSSDWRVARLQENQQIVVIEFPNLAEQGAAMNRVAALLEKAGAPHNRLLSDTELQQLMARSHDNAQTFYLGHDYTAEALARFFNLAPQQSLPLTPQELRLRQILLDSGLLVDSATGLQAPAVQALISFSATQADDPTTPIDESLDARRRESVLYHELSHGEFFTNPAYHDHCWQFWRKQLTESERARWRRFLASLNYDANDEELLVNETQALLMHTPDTRAFNAASLGITETALAELRDRFRAGMPK
jgi:hypothetical protein